MVSHDFLRYERIQVVYVGMTKNMNSRLKWPHPAETKMDCYLDCYAIKTDNPGPLEVEFIKRYRPFLNVQHNEAYIYGPKENASKPGPNDPF